MKLLFCSWMAEARQNCEQNQNHMIQRVSLDTGKANNWGQPHVVELHLFAGLGDKKKDEEILNSDRDTPLKAKVQEIPFAQDVGWMRPHPVTGFLICWRKQD